jgi:hypothetical protein
MTELMSLNLRMSGHLSKPLTPISTIYCRNHGVLSLPFLNRKNRITSIMAIMI